MAARALQGTTAYVSTPMPHVFVDNEEAWDGRRKKVPVAQGWEVGKVR